MKKQKKLTKKVSPLVSFKSQHKDTTYQAIRASQKQIFFEYLQNHTATCSMVCEATGIKQKCATRYKRELEDAGKLFEIKRELCELTGFRASYLTTKAGGINE
jgi:hypothetical protein